MANEPMTMGLMIKVKGEHRQEFFDMMKNHENGIALTKKSPGCISVEGRMSTIDDETVVIWEKWANKEAQAAYRKMRQDSGFFNDWVPKMAGPPVYMFLSADSF